MKQTEKTKEKLFGFDNDGENPFAWEDFCYEINTLLKDENEFYVVGTNMGWRHQSGWTTVSTNDPQKFMSKILPKTNDLSIEVFKSDVEGAICDMTIYHHDAPMGEYRTVYTLKHAIELKLIEEEQL